MTSHSRCAKDSASCDTKFCRRLTSWQIKYSMRDYGCRCGECLFSSKIGTKSLKDGSQDICEAKESNL